MQKKISRKWNALRHNDTMHHGLAIMYDKLGDWTSKTRDNSDDTLVPDLVEEMIVDQDVLDILGKMLQPLSELEKEFTKPEEPKRTQFIATLLVGALISVDPVKVFQDQVDLIRSVKGKQKIVSYISRGMNMNSNQAEQYIDILIKKANIIKIIPELNDHID
jgi:hypothetical protein